MTRVSSMSIVGAASALFALTSVLLFGMAIGFDPAAGARTTQRIASSSAGDAGYIRWGAVTDLLGYYLLPAGVIVAVRNRVPWTSETARDVSTVAGVVYATIGAIGAGILAAAAPPLIEEGAEARTALETVALTAEGLWQWVEPIPFFVWAAGVTAAFRAGASSWSWLFGTLAVGAVLVWFGRILDIEPVLIVGLGLWLAPFPLTFATVGSWAPEGTRR
jgi:hypothetical protein